MQKPFDEAQVLKANSRVDLKLVRSFERLEQELRQLGVEVKPTYRLQPPLGGLLQPLFHDATSTRRERKPL
jgi:hypothetical protein